MSFPFGLTGLGAEVVDKERRGKKFVITVAAQGITKRAARRAAMQEATGIIPRLDQRVVSMKLDRKLNFKMKRYLVVIEEEI